MPLRVPPQHAPVTQIHETPISLNCTRVLRSYLHHQHITIKNKNSKTLYGSLFLDQRAALTFKASERGSAQR